MEYFLFGLRIVLAGVFLLAGIGKLLDLKGSEKAVRAFGVPDAWAGVLAILLPLAEIIIAISLLSVSTSWFGAFGASLLLLVFTGGMLWQLKQGNAPDCHCFGQIHSEPVGKKSLARNAVLAVLAVGLVASGREYQGLPVTHLVNSFTEFMQIIFGFIIIGFLFILLLYLKNIMEKQTQILRRLVVIELIAGDGNWQERENVGNPNEGLPIGSPVPNFTMPTADGRVVSRKDLLARGKPILFFNVSPTCNPCQAILPAIEEWEKELADKINFVFISRGTAKENLAKFESPAAREIFIQDDRELADLMEIRWTPTALFVNKNGVIASHPAAGDTAIRELIEKIRKEDLDDELVYVAGEKENGKRPKIGQIIPDFALNDLSGKPITAKDLQGRKTLVTFWSMTCPHCVGMIEELSEWEKVKGQDEPSLIVFSDGKEEEHRDLKLSSSVIIDKDYKVSDEFGMFGTPSAVLVNEQGKIISETAVGAGQIWALIGRKMK